ncbi:MAG: hypothetical protein ACREFX_07460, partial [Opitutaceae bacterium]
MNQPRSKVIAGLCMLILRCAGAGAFGYPVTHPVFRPTETLPQVMRELAPVLKLSDTQLVAAVPETNGLQYVHCPACDSGAQDNQLAWNGPADPHGLHCRFDGTVFPNPKYPETGRLTVRDPTGELHTFRYYVRPDGLKCFLDAKADFLAKMGMARFAQDYGEAYELTGNSAYARRTALILARFAAVFPHYMPWHDYPAKGGDYPIENQPPDAHFDDWNESFWTPWSYQMFPVPLLLAYDAIHDSGALQRIAPDLDARIVRNIFDRSIQFDLDMQDNLTTALPYSYRALTQAGLVLGRPALIPHA